MDVYQNAEGDWVKVVPFATNTNKVVALGWAYQVVVNNIFKTLQSSNGELP